MRTGRRGLGTGTCRQMAFPRVLQADGKDEDSAKGTGKLLRPEWDGEG